MARRSNDADGEAAGCELVARLGEVFHFDLRKAVRRGTVL